MISRTKNNFGNLDVWVLMAIILFGLVLYIFPLKNATFCFDDDISIKNNAVIRQMDIPKIFNAFNTRFLVGLSFAGNYQWCALNPVGYRLINLLIHCLNALLVYLLIKSTLYLYAKGEPMLFCRLEWAAFLGSMLFLCHPIQTEPVNFITQRFVLMGTFFYLLTLYLYIQYRCGKQKVYIIASQLAAIAAMFCKEFVVTLPLMLVLYEFYFIDPLNETIGKRLRRLIPFFLIALIVPFLLFRTPTQALGVSQIAQSHSDITRATSHISRKQYFLTELNVVCTYVRLLFLPVHQNFDYDYPLSGALDSKTALCGAFLLSLLAIAGVTYKSYRMVSFSILWFFIALSVESSVIPIGNVIDEYRLYLASVGFVFLVMMAVDMKPENQKRFFMIAGVILIGFSVLTYQRNKVWRDEITLWNDTIHKSPHKARAYFNRARCYFNQAKFTQAMSDFSKVIAMHPRGYDAPAHFDRGLIYDEQGHTAQAFSDYTQAIELQPDSADFYNNRGCIYAQQGEFIPAMSDFNRAIEINPDDPVVYKNRIDVYQALGHNIKI